MINLNRIKALIIKDWKEFFRYKNSIAPLLIVPLIFCVILPLGMGLVFKAIPESEILKDQDTVQMVNQFLGKVAIPTGLTLGETFAYVMSVYSFMPMFLIVPIMFSSITSAYSIVGEKEAKTIEGLLYTPVSNEELLLTKILSSFIPSMIVTFISFLLYTIIVNSLFWGTLHGFSFPNATWMVAVFLLSPIVSFAAICLMVITSSKSKSAIEAQQNSGYLILPIILLFVGQLSGVAFLTPIYLLSICFVVGILDYFLFNHAYKRLNREALAIGV